MPDGIELAGPAIASRTDTLVGHPDQRAFPPSPSVKSKLLVAAPGEKNGLSDFLSRLCSAYVDLHFAYIEISSLICLDAAPNSLSKIHFPDAAARLDQTVNSNCAPN
ncbi:hypothetical protein BDV93DRAFT_564977 [Ceratobasidium sp. AG-I]|nr:hypothetical protein BDV93DRAFT_564977 [Ceratobasidium sp. AG-I]